MLGLAPWEEVVDPGGGEVEAFIACAQEVVALVDDARTIASGGRPGVEWSGGRADGALGVDGGRPRRCSWHPCPKALFAAADLQPGEVVVDIGCGTGSTTRRAADLVGARQDPSSALTWHRR